MVRDYVFLWVQTCVMKRILNLILSIEANKISGRGWRALDQIGRNGDQMPRQTIKSDHIHPFWVPLDAFDHSETSNWVETSKTHEFNLERKSQVRSLKTVTIPNHQTPILNEKARGLISGTGYNCAAFIEDISDNLNQLETEHNPIVSGKRAVQFWEKKILFWVQVEDWK